jgi:electron transport complex protein RnfB
MGNKSYERLAEALDRLPSGFPQTPSRVELLLLEKAFSIEEAEFASRMGRQYQTAAELAEADGLTEARARELLKGLLPRSLVRKRLADGQETYRLGPFVVGWYEAVMQGPMRNDVEFARIFEQYMKEGGGERIMSPRPGVLGVVPVRGSLKSELLQPYDDIEAHFARHERFGIVDCICRIERNLMGSKCSTPVKRCGFVGLPPQTPLSENVLDRDQALKLFTQLEDDGHVHTGFYGFIHEAETPQFVGCCNCCGDCCGVLRAVNDFGCTEGPQRSNYRAVLTRDNCLACGNCLSRCQMHAIAEGEDGIPKIHRERCIGCGLCVTTCSGEAIELEPVSKEEWFYVPSSFEEWEERRIQNMSAEI